MTTCTCGRPVVAALVAEVAAAKAAGIDMAAAEQRSSTRLCGPCWRRQFAWEWVQHASEAYNAAIADYVLNRVPSRDVQLLIALRHAKRAYQEARAAYEAAKAAA